MTALERYNQFRDDGEKRTALKKLLEHKTLREALDAVLGLYRPVNPTAYPGDPTVRLAYQQVYNSGAYDAMDRLELLTLRPRDKKTPALPEWGVLQDQKEKEKV
jgi:hypothetical protein